MSSSNNAETKHRVMMISHSAVIDVYQDKLRHLAREADFDVTLVLPERYFEAGRVVAAHQGDGSYTVIPLPGRFVTTGRQNLFTLRGLRSVIRRVRPDILHLEEEPESLISYQAIRAALSMRRVPRIVGFTWRNIDVPFAHWPWYTPRRIALDLIQRTCLPHYDALICGSHEGPALFTRFELSCPMPIIPQYGVNPELYTPDGPAIDLHSVYNIPSNHTLVGYIGRILPMKGIDTLIEACAATSNTTHCVIVGHGASDWLSPIIERTGMHSRITFVEGIAPSEIPAVMRALDVLVLPSRTTPTWREQFGRVLVEAMACGVPVVGSSSGEIPHVIGDPRMIFPEGDAQALARIIRSLATPESRALAGRRGRERVLSMYTNQRIAADLAGLYRSLLAPSP